MVLYLKVLLSLFTVSAWAEDPVRPYQTADRHLRTTSFLNQLSYLVGFDDRQWYLDNIPFIDVPDESLQEVYYYRASVIKRHLKSFHEGHGFVFTEFIQPVAWASKGQSIPDSAAHQIIEARWLRDPRYTDDTIQLYTRGGVETLSGITYTHYIHRAILEQAQATGNIDFLVSQLEGVVNIFGLWESVFDNTTGLYRRTPLLDAQEYSLPGWLVGGPNGGPVQTWNSFENNFTTIDYGPETYRPSHNSFMLAGARAIASIAQISGNEALQQHWSSTAAVLYSNMHKLLWDHDLGFWIDVIAGSNQPAIARQLIGFYPLRFDIGTDDEMIRGLEAGLTPERLLTSYGPTTLERSNEYYTSFKNTTYCCLWQGQSWPFSTCVYLGSLARIARENSSSIITPEFFHDQFATYTRTNYLDDTPFTAEVHYPETNAWSGLTLNHSEHYLHSTYLDNVITNLIGVLPTIEDMLCLHPLVPSNWSYFLVENLPYHGSLLTILWDQDGSHYNVSGPTGENRGLSIYSNGSLLHHQATLQPVNITLPFSSKDAAERLASQPRYENILANPNSPWGYPNVTADSVFSSNGDVSAFDAFHLNDGLLWYEDIPSNRWTNNQSTLPFATINITFPRPRTFESVSLGVWTDVGRGGMITCPQAIRVSNFADKKILAERNPWVDCKPNALNTILFDMPSVDSLNRTTQSRGTPVTSDFVQIQLVNEIHKAVALSEIQIWVPENLGPRYEIEDGLAGTFLGGFSGKQSGMNNSIENGGVRLRDNGWVEVANVQAPSGQAGIFPLTVIGGNKGSLAVQMNFMPGSNQTVEFDGSQNQSGASQMIHVKFMKGRNYVTLMQMTGEPWVDALVVG